MTHDDIILGWREWVALPELGIDKIKAKIDTGARTSTLHAFAVEAFEQDQQKYVSFAIHPIQKNDKVVVECTAKVKDQRWVTDSGGHPEYRYVIETPIRIAGKDFMIEITLTNRDVMRFRMLLGRSALKHRFHINPAASYLTKKSI